MHHNLLVFLDLIRTENPAKKRLSDGKQHHNEARRMPLARVDLSTENSENRSESMQGHSRLYIVDRIKESTSAYMLFSFLKTSLAIRSNLY